MKKLMVLASAFLMVFAVVSSASALNNGDFEDGLAGWNSVGSVAVVDFNDGSHPSGPIADFIASVQGMDNNFALLGAHTTGGTAGIYQDWSVSGLTQLEISFDWAFDFVDWSRRKDDVFLAFADTSITLEEIISGAQPSFLGFGAVWGHYSNIWDIVPWTNSGNVGFALIEDPTFLTNSLKKSKLRI